MTVDDIEREEHFAGCLIGALVGDSLGAKLEGFEPAIVERRYPGEQGLLHLSPGRYTCVGEMIAAVSVSLAAHPEFDPDDMASRLLQFRTAGRGYGQGTSYALDRMSAGRHWSEAGAAGEGRGCYGNGAATRAVPVGLLDSGDAEWLRWVAEESAAITHQHSWGSEGAVLVALAVALALASAGGSLLPQGFIERLKAETQVREFRSRLETAAELLGRAPNTASLISRLGNNATALGSVVTAVFCFAENAESFESAIVRALSLGGNASAIASMTGALSGAYLGRAAIPARWVESLEDGQVSAALLAESARSLARRAG